MDIQSIALAKIGASLAALMANETSFTVHTKIEEIKNDRNLKMLGAGMRIL